MRSLGKQSRRTSTFVPLPDRERLRWFRFPSYIHALVYHERPAAEQSELRSRLEASAATDVDRQKVAVVEATAELERLNRWLDLMVTAETLEEVGIG